jgi:hypothetical protein
LIQCRIQHGEDTETGLRDQVRFIQKALRKSVTENSGAPNNRNFP